MTTIRLRISKNILPKFLLEKTFFARWGRIPIPTAISYQNEILCVSCDWSSSGTVHVFLPNRSLGPVLFSTETLISRREPYSLLKELIRGQLGRLIRRLTDWQQLGFRIPLYVQKELRCVYSKMPQLMTGDESNPDYDFAAYEALQEIFAVTASLLDLFNEQTLSARQRQTPVFPVVLGFRDSVSFSEQPSFDTVWQRFGKQFRTVNPIHSWRQIETASGQFNWSAMDRYVQNLSANGSKILFGPLVSWNRSWFPDWIFENGFDFDTLSGALYRFVEAFIGRYLSYADSWLVAEDLLNNDLFEISISEQISLCNNLAIYLKVVNRHIPRLIAIDQPWGDYLLEDVNATPHDYGEIIRDTKLYDAFFLKINQDIAPNSTFPRDPMELSRQLDHWSSFGLPLHVSFSVPSAPHLSVGKFLSENTETSLTGSYHEELLNWSVRTQQEWARRYLMTMLTKRMVVAVYWNQFIDGRPAGVMDESGQMRRRPCFEDEDTTSSLTPFPNFGDSLLTEPPTMKLSSAEEDQDTDLSLKIQNRQHEKISNFLHSGLLDALGNPKPALTKLLSLRNAFFE